MNIKMNKTRRITYSAIVLALILGVGGYLAINKNTVYNNTPNIQSKVMGSELLNMHITPYKSLDVLVKKADLIIIGKIDGDGVTKKKEYKPIELQEKQNALGITSEYNATQVNVKVDKVLFGDKDIKEITFSQLGKAGDDYGQTKARNGEKMLLILKRSE